MKSNILDDETLEICRTKGRELFEEKKKDYEIFREIYVEITLSKIRDGKIIVDYFPNTIFYQIYNFEGEVVVEKITQKTLITIVENLYEKDI